MQVLVDISQYHSPCDHHCSTLWNANSVYIALTVRRKDIIKTYPILMIKNCSKFSVQRHNFNTIKVHVLVTLAMRMLL
jgi:hypothetical protein